MRTQCIMMRPVFQTLRCTHWIQNYRYLSGTLKVKRNEYFGYKEVDEGERQMMVNQVFSKVSNYYDKMNDFMSMGAHRIWKNNFVNQTVDPKLGQKVLDLAGGTGDISFRIIDNLSLKIFNDPNISQDMYKDALNKFNDGFPIVTVCDISKNMIEYGKKRMAQLKIKGIDWVVCGAECMPFSDNSFDIVTVSFGLRNMSNIPKVMKEVYRVLKPSGRFLILEFSHPTNNFISMLYKFYTFNIIPKIGKYIVNDSESYQYLVESIQMFYKQDELCQVMLKANFNNVFYQNWSNGIVAVHQGNKPHS